MCGASIRSSSTGNALASRDGRMLALSGVFLTCASVAFEGDLSMGLVVSGLVLAISGVALWLSTPVAMPRTCEHCDMTLLDWASMHGPARPGRDAA